MYVYVHSRFFQITLAEWALKTASAHQQYFSTHHFIYIYIYIYIYISESLSLHKNCLRCNYTKYHETMVTIAMTRYQNTENLCLKSIESSMSLNQSAIH